MMKAISGLTMIYVAAMAILYFKGKDFEALTIILAPLGIGIFSAPMIAAWGLARMFAQWASKAIMLAFGVTYSLFTIYIFYDTFFTGEHDAQYQLEVLIVPPGGLLGLLVFAAFSAARERLSRRLTAQDDRDDG